MHLNCHAAYPRLAPIFGKKLQNTAALLLIQSIICKYLL